MEKRVSNDGNEHCQNRAGTDRILLSGLASIVTRGSEMGWVESIQKAIEYIEEHLLEDLTIESISISRRMPQLFIFNGHSPF